MVLPWVRLEYAQALFSYSRLTGDSEEIVATGEQVWMSARRTGNVFSPGPWPQEFLNAVQRMGGDVSRALVA
ncbi:hypothetical protein AOZ06_04065 [Kibdelosporangium phytohabitans]|uniref:Uncharacterized protein n=2 Tax=Kibdelosporangium phytohabitans TaxID=860235 RepID=A0A0N9HSS0_9PSEU|nr:hypothetical protein AOZ06_04065 [Kibdelosporangium phytohabitans]